MSTIKLEITIDSTQFHLLGPLGELLGAKGITVSGPNTLSIAAGHAETEPKEDAKPKSPAKATKTKSKPVEEIEVKEEEDLGQTDGEESQISIEELKGLLAKKVGAHRPAIVQKLRELGAPKISELEASDYREMYDFMAKLK